MEGGARQGRYVVPRDENKFLVRTEVESAKRRWAMLRFALERGSRKTNEPLLKGVVVCSETTEGTPERAEVVDKSGQTLGIIGETTVSSSGAIGQ